MGYNVRDTTAAGLRETPARRAPAGAGANAAPAPAPTDRITRTVKLHPEVREQMRAAAAASPDHDRLTEWLADALEIHAGRTPAQRERLAAALPELDARVHKTPDKLDLSAETDQAVEDARARDAIEAHRVLNRKEWMSEAICAAYERQAKKHGPIPPAPARMPRSGNPSPVNNNPSTPTHLPR